MKITLDIDVERKKSVVNFKFAENEDSFRGFASAREALGMMYAELCVKFFPDDILVGIDFEVLRAKLGYPPRDMPKYVVQQSKEHEFVSTEIKSFFSKETLRELDKKVGQVRPTLNLISGFFKGLEDSLMEVKNGSHKSE